MEAVDPLAFGARVRKRREELGLGQAALGEKVGLSQQQVGWIEAGKPKRPNRWAADLADALWTTREWLCWQRGPKEAGPTVLSAEEFANLYRSLPREERQRLTQILIKAARKTA
jgi:transcriptional regulator with XRE-family HTH domain